jgi:hypothetical protein
MLPLMPPFERAAPQWAVAALFFAVLCLSGCTSEDRPAGSDQPSAAPDAFDACPTPNPEVDGNGDPCRGIQDGSLVCQKMYEDAQELAVEQREAALANVSAHCSTGTYVP